MTQVDGSERQPRCACRAFCGDVAEENDAPNAVCRGFATEGTIEARLRALVEQALPLVAYAVDVPSHELEAEQWLADARALVG